MINNTHTIIQYGLYSVLFILRMKYYLILLAIFLVKSTTVSTGVVSGRLVRGLFSDAFEVYLIYCSVRALKGRICMDIAPYKKPRPQNVAGNLFVDESCIDCKYHG